MRRKARTDKNQADFMRRVRRMGVSLIDTSKLSGKRTFDMIAAFRGVVYVVELKNPEEFPKYFFSLTPEQQDAYMREKAATDNERNTDEELMRAGCRLILTYSADHFLRLIGAIKKPFSNED